MMKTTMKKAFTLFLTLSMLLSTTMLVAYADDKEGTGEFTVIIANGSDTGISIEGDTFHAFQIFAADDVTSYSVAEDFRAFFVGTKTGGDGANNSYNFDQYLSIINAYESSYLVANTEDAKELAEYNTALDNYNQLAGAYMNSYANNMYALAIEIRGYLDGVGTYNGGTVTCMVHATAGARQSDGYEYANLVGLDSGYYFIFNQQSTMNGIGIAASGGFMPLTTSSDIETTVNVKQSIPTMTKTIYHDDEEKWGLVGDSQIGDKVEFRIISTLPSNIDDYILSDENENKNAIDKYNYILTDEMSAGLSFNDDITVYSDDNGTAVDEKYYEVVKTDTGFVLTFDAIEFLTDYPKEMTLYIYYSATLNENAVVASDKDENTATLSYNTNPSDEDDIGTTSSTVFHYTFALDVTKVDENADGLAGARFGLFDVDGYAIPLAKGETDYTTGVVSYYYDLNTSDTVSDGGYIITETVYLRDASGAETGETVTGKFRIYGLDDQTWYTLREVEAPDGYNTADQFDIYFTAIYNSLGTEITNLTDGSAYVYTSQNAVTGDWSSTSTIVNRLKIYLPETGGVGTVLFQVGGGALMLGAAAMLLVNKRKKEEN